MKKYILFISLCCFIAQLSAINVNTPKDSIYIYKGKVDPNIDLGNLNFNFNFDIDTSALLALGENFEMNESDIENWRESLKEAQRHLKKAKKDLKNYNWGEKSVYDFNQRDKIPKRKETRSFSPISEIQFFHQYGNIIVKESNSKQVELEIQYFGAQTQKNPVNISAINGLLSINCKGTGNAQIDFIINIPRGTKLNINLKYGKLRMDEFHAPFTSDLSYSSLNAEGFSGSKPVIKDKYGNITIGQAGDLDLDLSYSKINIARADQIELSGKYSDYIFGDVENLVIKNSSSGDFKIGSIKNVSGDLNYADMKIGNLVSKLTAKCNYSDIQINSISHRANINVRGDYSNVTLSVPPNIGIAFNVSLRHGDLDVSNKYTVKYTEQTEISDSVMKKGQIGNKKPTAVIDVTSNYSDVKIK